MKILKHQHWHFLLLMILLVCIAYCVNTDADLLNGELGGVGTSIWFVIAIFSPIVHQIYVLICWRLELYYNSISKKFGANGFKLYKIGFFIFFVPRLLTIIFLAISNGNTLFLNNTFAYLLSGVIFIPAFYLFYSVGKYFGIDRACGIDHFHPEELKKVPFVKRGIFKYTSNAMYIFGFLILYIPGILFLSKAAILVAIFNHLYIWVHYYFTELPDMKIIYKN